MRSLAAALLLCGGCDEVFSIDRLPDPPPDMACDVDFCIDRTEVTRIAYAEFVAAMPTGLGGTGCDGNDILPNGSWPPPPGDNRPVVNVDWCDAFQYCAWRDKRLCGHRAGGPVVRDDNTKVTHSQWYYACTGGMQGKPYPYGDTFVDGACNVGQPNGGPGVFGVEDNPECEGGFPGLLNMVGNVWEWEDSCSGDGPAASCDIRGGDYFGGPHDCGASVSHPRSENTFSRFGIRCCRDR